MGEQGKTPQWPVPATHIQKSQLKTGDSEDQGTSANRTNPDMKVAHEMGFFTYLKHRQQVEQGCGE